MKQNVILIISIITGIVAAVVTKHYFDSKDSEVRALMAEIRSAQRLATIVVVKRDLPAGTVLQFEDLGLQDYPEGPVRGHAVRREDANSLVGRKILRLLERGAPVYWSDIEGGEPGSRGLADDIPQKMRAISITVSGAASVSGMVRPNDRVDVLGTFTFPSAANPAEMELVTLTVLQDVTVLAAGRETAKTIGSATRSGNYSTVTLSVTPREAEMLVFAEQIKGRLVLSLRNPADVSFERELPRVNFSKIQEEIRDLNTFRQEQLLRKRAP